MSCIHFLIFLICLTASAAGGICGIGGGVVIKPVLDAMGVMSVSAISFLSGLTVFSMAAVSVLRQRGQRLVDFRIGSLLAIGAIVGGMLGNAAFKTITVASGQDVLAGMLQAILLAIVTGLTLVYSIYLKKDCRPFDCIPLFYVL